MGFAMINAREEELGCIRHVSCSALTSQYSISSQCSINEDLHNSSTSSVRIGTTLSPSFITTSGVRQGCVLAPALFCRAVDCRVMERVASRTGFSLCNDHFTDLDYADDVVLLAHKMDDFHSAVEVFFETTA